ncbi:hypothetical protein BA895_19135 [Humibacillus sp. DSM 29435]|uniref:SAM-dependent methyltransferase n=1 Tax=Humibacillus sp. DSM 29435 TaxID=1869167 RepID=UPI0008727055|nr:class I SAM-dependent methyltransferase [Humibacillus sp. DSM 29435]OFE16431.1 hypothetical protein BA895_19135 [Humibacillus sp. DSM 29435]
MVKPTTLMALEDYAVPAERDLRREGGVSPGKHATSSSRRDGTAVRTAVGVVDRCPERYHRFEHTDRWADSHKARIDTRIRQLIAMGYHGDASKDLTRTRSVIDMTNPATQELGKAMPTIAAWFKLIPRAVALDIIYDPEKGRLCNGVVLDEESIRWFKNIDDAIGIRSRAAVLRELLLHEADKSGCIAVASLACGAAQPVLETMAELLRDGRAADSSVTLVDLDRESLGMAVRLADQHGITDRVTTVTGNILSLNGIDIAPGPHLESGAGVGYDVVEALGFLEYLPPENQESYTYNGVVDEKRSRAGAVVFLKNAYDLVKPGGLLIFGNMLDETHKQLEFTLNTVQWPHIQPRSIKKMLQIIAAAGVDPAAEVDIYCPTDGVYAVYAIRKPCVQK